MGGGEVFSFDRIVNACGHIPNCTLLPLVKDLLEQSEEEIVGGLPTLSQDLQWGNHKQLFVVGALAALQVGPDAGNLMGIRRAAQVITNNLGRREWLRDTTTVLGNVRGNRYAAFADSESESDAECEPGPGNNRFAALNDSQSESNDEHEEPESDSQSESESEPKEETEAQSVATAIEPDSTMCSSSLCEDVEMPSTCTLSTGTPWTGITSNGTSSTRTPSTGTVSSQE